MQDNKLVIENIDDIRVNADKFFNSSYYSEAIKCYEKYLKYNKNKGKDNYYIYNVLGWLYYSFDNAKSIKYLKKYFDFNYKNNYIDYESFCNLMLSILKSPEFNQYQIKIFVEKYINKIRKKLITKEEVFNHSDKKWLGRKLNIGYISGEFSMHAVMLFVMPILKNHNTELFNIFLYSATPSSQEDYVTEILKQKKIFNYRNILNLPFKESAKIIYDDKIDILIDLSSLTNKNSMVLLYKPAPVQMSYMGFLNTTGMREVDYIIADKTSIPDDMTEQYTENILYLPRYECFDFSSYNKGKKNDVSPFKNNGYITFGSFNCTSKINDNVLKCWAEILKKVPNSRLYIYRSDMKDCAKKKIERTLKKYDVEMNRICIDNTFHSSYFDVYKTVDIALDTFPFTGLTITIETAYAGVPTVTKVCDSFQSKGGKRVNDAIGFSKIVAYSDKEYIDIAVNLAGDILKLEEYRNLAKEIVQKSSLADCKKFTKYFEEGLIKVAKKYYKINLCS